MMTVWKILEIAPTQDVKEIKNAYAKKIKQIKPEIDPQGFQQLREAYEVALKYSKDVNQNCVIQNTNEIPQPLENQYNLNNANDLANYILDLAFKDQDIAIEEIKKLNTNGTLDNFEFSNQFQNTLAINLLAANSHYHYFIGFLFDFFKWYDVLNAQTNQSFFRVALINLSIQLEPYHFYQHLVSLSKIKNKKESKQFNLNWYECKAAKMLLLSRSSNPWSLKILFSPKTRKAICKIIDKIEKNYPEVLGRGLPFQTYLKWKGKGVYTFTFSLLNSILCMVLLIMLIVKMSTTRDVVNDGYSSNKNTAVMNQDSGEKAKLKYLELKNEKPWMESYYHNGKVTIGTD